VHIDPTNYDNDIKVVKKELAKYLTSISDREVVPFVSPKYSGKRYYNSGEIITISYQVQNPGIQACQIDNIIALDAVEAKFKKDFLDMPAAKQGLVLGLIKTALIEQHPNAVFKRLGIKEDAKELTDLQEFEFNLSSKEIQLRKVTYVEKGSFKQASREIVWSSRDWDILQKILKDFDLGLSFDKLLRQAKDKLKKTRSTKRMAGVFKSMISIKSGEVGKKKGYDKQKALDKVQKLFGESTDMKFADFINEISKKVYKMKDVEDEIKKYGYKEAEWHSTYRVFKKDGITVTAAKVKSNLNLKQLSGRWDNSKTVYLFDNKYNSVKDFLDILEGKEPKRKKTQFLTNKNYVITALDANKKPMRGQEDITATYVGTGKGKEAPNKGKDVYIFREEDTNNLLKIGFWELESEWVSIKEV
jgi:hypothetical protein